MKHNISLSTLRRHIKAGKVSYKVEEGRYLLWDESEGNSLNADQSGLSNNNATSQSTSRDSASQQQGNLSKLERDLKLAQEEIAELKTLIALYEEKIPQQRFNG